MAIGRDRLSTTLGIDRDCADQVRALMQGTRAPETVPQTAAWIAQCYHRPSAIELQMHAIDALIGGSGCEAIWGAQSCTWPVAEYSNQGDTYTPTILYDYTRARFCLTSWGDWVEQYGERYSVE